MPRLLKILVNFSEDIILQQSLLQLYVGNLSPCMLLNVSAGFLGAIIRWVINPEI